MGELATKQETGISTVSAINPEALIMKAVENNVNVETLEKLLSMREKLLAEQARAAYFSALSGFQSECPIIKKEKVVKGKDGRERYRYAPLDDILKQVSPILQKHGLSYSIKTEQKEAFIIAEVTVHHIAGHSECSSFPVPIDPDAYMNDSQKAASAQTFAKRYAFQNALGILTGDQDDDAQSLGEVDTPKQLYARFRRHMDAVVSLFQSVDVIKRALADGDLSTASEAWYELEEEEQKALWMAHSKGGVFTTEEQRTIKTSEFRKAHFGENA